MQVQSSRFGKIEIDHSDILLMPQGLIGFETCRHWVLLSNPSTPQAAWLQSVALPNVALPVVSPRLFVPDYKVHVSARQLSMIHLRNDDQIYILAVVSKNGATLTANLKSPILLNATRQMGVQCITSDEAPLALPIGLSATAFAGQTATRSTMHSSPTAHSTPNRHSSPTTHSPQTTHSPATTHFAATTHSSAPPQSPSASPRRRAA